MKTSITDPLIIDQIQPFPEMGCIGLCLCPGKKQKDRSWNRDISTDIQTILTWGATIVLTLLEEQDMQDLNVSNLGTCISNAGLKWFHLPIKDYSIPTSSFERQWKTISKDLRAHLKAKNNILIHCNAGLGRSGTIAAKLLVELGFDAKDAIQQVRTTRPGAVETSEQFDYIMRLK